MTEQQREEWQNVCHHLADNGLEIGARVQVMIVLAPEPGVLLGHVYMDDMGWQAVVQLDRYARGVLLHVHYSRVTPA